MRLWYLHTCLLALMPFLSMSDDSCVMEPISGEDSKFCRDELKVEYPMVGNVACQRIPPCYFKDLTKTWDQPSITFSGANKDKSYVLIMADPDAPSRDNPKRSHWRHYVAVGVPGKDLLAGKMTGETLSEYARPSPPEGTGEHRYQVLVYEQPSASTPELSPEEKKSLSNWDPRAFAADNGLVGPVSTTHFKAQNPSRK